MRSKLFTIVAQLKGLYLMIKGNEDTCKELVVHEDRYMCAFAYGFVDETGQLKVYSEFKRKLMK